MCPSMSPGPPTPVRPGTITVTGGETSDPVELPAGTVVTLTEATPTDLPDGVVWEGYTWVPADGVTVSEDGKTASFTVQPGGEVALQLTNTVTTLPTTTPPRPHRPRPHRRNETTRTCCPAPAHRCRSGSFWLDSPWLRSADWRCWPDGGADATRAETESHRGSVSSTSHPGRSAPGHQAQKAPAPPLYRAPSSTLRSAASNHSLGMAESPVRGAPWIGWAEPASTSSISVAK